MKSFLKLSQINMRTLLFMQIGLGTVTEIMKFISKTR